MRKISFFRLICLALVAMNIFNYFFLATSYTGIKLKESATYFNLTFMASDNLENVNEVVTGMGGGNSSIIFIAILLINVALGYIILTKTDTDYQFIPIKSIVLLSGLGILFQLFLFMITAPSEVHEKTYIVMISRGMLGTMLYILSYAFIIFIFMYIFGKKIEYGDALNFEINAIDIFLIATFIELILMFFYTPINATFYRVSKYHDKVKWFAKFYLSPFEMTYKHSGASLYGGKIESYFYMWILFLIFTMQIILVFIKSKKKYICIPILSIISIVIITISIFDLCDSAYAFYITNYSKTFFRIAGIGYYLNILINLFVLLLCFAGIKQGNYIRVDYEQMRLIEENEKEK